ncbi:MAG TPA: glycosyltransferase family 4 protein, partial [Verrucomicrobiae bacterium]|nr:glycosyltransferase family 4 protein [Verrucomicrobiae bacterium]
PTTWQTVLLEEFEKEPALHLHVIALRKRIDRSFSFRRNGVTFHIVKYHAGMRGPTLFWTDTLLIQRLLRQINPDVVHAWGSERGAALVGGRLKYPFLITIQGLLTWYVEVIQTSAAEKFAAWTEKLGLSRAREVTTESKFAVDYLQRKYPRLAIHQVEHAPNWLFHRIERRPTTEPIRFFINGTLGYRKGTDLLLAVLNELASELNFEAIVIGNPNDPFLAPWKTSLSPELWRRLTFKSNLPPSEIAAELSRATLLLLPTRADTSPNAVKEALVAGVPVVASGVGGIPDYVFPGENGILFAPGDKSEFINAIRAACKHPLFSRGLVSEESLNQNREYLSPARMAERFLSLYHRVKAR